MKNLIYIVMLSTGLLLGCGGTNQSKAGEAGEITTAADGGEVTKAKPVQLDKTSFKKLVMDYEKNPKTWVFEGDKPAIIDFYADWCRPCRMIAPIMEELAVEYQGQIDIYKVDTEAQRELAAVFGITSLPTVLFIPKEGNPSAQKGALPKESYKKIIDEFLLKKGAGQTSINQ